MKNETGEIKIRKIRPEDNPGVEALIRFCLREYGADKPGCAWEDPDLGRFYEKYQAEKCSYWVAEEGGHILAGCGIGPVPEAAGVCELQKMYAYPEARGLGIGRKLLEQALDFAKEHYWECYLETFLSMREANAFYKKHGFESLPGPIADTGHYACDAWYRKRLHR